MRRTPAHIETRFIRQVNSAARHTYLPYTTSTTTSSFLRSQYHKPLRERASQISHRSMSSAADASFPPPSLQPVINDLASHLKSNSLTLALAETATGGLLSSSLLSVPGASKFFRGGLTMYTLESRVKYAGWTNKEIENYKGPTTEIVSGLAKEVKKDLGPDYVLAESGTAGPTGGNTRNRTPGYVALAVVSKDGVYTREVETGSAERVENMLRFAQEGVKFLLEVLRGEVKPDAEGTQKL